MTVYMFPGQGSQAKGMGEEVFTAYPRYTAQASEFLGYDLAELCLKDPLQQLDQTEYTQPALYVVSSLMYLKTIEEKGRPHYVLGHSLGEYVALFAANCFDFLTGLSLVVQRGKLMGMADGGGMLAIVGLNIENIKEILQDSQLDNIDIANHNTSQQIVISGHEKDIQRAELIFSQKAQLCIPLKVSGAFHSRYMENAKNQFAEHLKKYHFTEPEISVIANITGQPCQKEDIKHNLESQITGTVQWVESIQYLMGLGEQDFQQIGPGNVLLGMLRRINPISAGAS